MDGGYSVSIWGQKFYVHVVMADLESDLCDDVSGCLDTEIEHHDRIGMDTDSFWR